MWYNICDMESEINELKNKLEQANKVIKKFNSEKAALKKWSEELTYREANLRKKYEAVGLSYD